ncbi:MAG TPA: hypothetical protein VFU48_10670, partial [Nitrospira sp.]|nr:hypothetical protein [Nitrospira sp.]
MVIFGKDKTFAQKVSPMLEPSPEQVERFQQKQDLKILIYRFGQLGDTIVALPALWAIRHAFPYAQLT